MVSVQSGLYTFRLRCPLARDVYLVGDFNNWSTTATPMRRTWGDLWQVSLPLPPGPHRFRYFVWRLLGSPVVLRDEQDAAPPELAAG